MSVGHLEPMFTNEELAQIFIDDNSTRSDRTEEQVGAVGMTVRQATELWRILSEGFAEDAGSKVSPVEVGVCFMAGLLVAQRARTLRKGNSADYHLWVNEGRTVLVRMWDNGTVEVATRETPAHTWGPPITCDEEKV